MKNKKFTYVLVFLVTVVWGLIIYRIFKSAGGADEESFAKIENTPVKEPYDDSSIPKETTRLLLNYPDPFAVKKERDTIASVPKKTVPKDVTTVKPVNWSFIKYSGFIRNPRSKSLVAVMNINGKAVLMNEGETVNQVKLVRNL